MSKLNETLQALEAQGLKIEREKPLESVYGDGIFESSWECSKWWVSEHGLSHSVASSLAWDGIDTLEKLKALSTEEIRRYPGVGITRLMQIAKIIGRDISHIIDNLGPQQRRRLGLEPIKKCVTCPHCGGSVEL